MALILTILGWLGIRSLARVDALEKNSVTREELKQSLDQMRLDRLAMHVENKEALQRIEEKLDATARAAVATRLERAESDIVDLREWKHRVADPYVGAVDVLKTRVDSIERRMT